MSAPGTNRPDARQVDDGYLREQLVQAVNRNPVSVDDAWALIHRWDALVEAIRAADASPPAGEAEE